MCKIFVEPDRPRMTIWRMRNASWITRATDTHSECVILIAFPLQIWTYQNATIFRFTYISSLIISLRASVGVFIVHKRRLFKVPL
jgi:hypothetical protein